MEGYRFVYCLEVRYSEIDRQNIVFNAHYLTYLDCAFTKYLREGLSLDMDNLIDRKKFDVVIAKTTLVYKQPAYLNDVLNIYCRTSNIGESSMNVEFAIQKVNQSNPILYAEIVYVNVDGESKQKQSIPEHVRSKILNYEKYQTRLKSPIKY